jgi:hypothetical protein
MIAVGVVAAFLAIATAFYLIVHGHATADQIATWAILAAAPLQVGFFLAYSLFSPWWRTWLGVALWMKSGSLAMVLAVIFIAYRYEVAIPRWLAATVYGLVFLGIAAHLSAYILLRFSPEGRAETGSVWHMARRRFR